MRSSMQASAENPLVVMLDVLANYLEDARNNLAAAERGDGQIQRAQPRVATWGHQRLRGTGR